MTVYPPSFLISTFLFFQNQSILLKNLNHVIKSFSPGKCYFLHLHTFRVFYHLRSSSTEKTACLLLLLFWCRTNVRKLPSHCRLSFCFFPEYFLLTSLDPVSFFSVSSDECKWTKKALLWLSGIKRQPNLLFRRQHDSRKGNQIHANSLRFTFYLKCR